MSISTPSFWTVFTFPGWVSPILGILLMVALFSATERRTANRFLAVAVGCSVYRQWLISWEAWAQTEHRFLVRSSLPLELLAIPAIYLYLRAFTTPFRLSRSHLLHLVPTLLGLLWYLLVLQFGSEDLFRPGPVLDKERFARLCLRLAVAIPYFTASLRTVATFQNRMKGHLSTLGIFHLKWLSLLIHVIYCVLAIDIVDLFTGPHVPVWQLFPTVGFLALVFLTLFSLRYSPAFAHALQQERDRVSGEADRAGLPEEQKTRLSLRLREALEKEKLYLNPELRLSDLAQRLGIKPYRMSEVITQGLGTTFYDLINKYRVEQAKQLLQDPKTAHLNLLGIAFESGFRSKSVFNGVFKKETGQTPSQFRNSGKRRPDC